MKTNTGLEGVEMNTGHKANEGAGKKGQGSRGLGQGISVKHSVSATTPITYNPLPTTACRAEAKTPTPELRPIFGFPPVSSREGCRVELSHSFSPIAHYSSLITVLILLFSLVLLSPSKDAFAAGLDTTFNNTGTVIHNNAAGGNSNDTGYSITTDSSGRILVAGYSKNASSNEDMVIWRYNVNGTLDTTFNGTGYVIHNSAAGGNGNDYGLSIVTDSTGRILVAGYSKNASNNYDMVIWRYTSNGTLDTTFNGTGYVVHNGAAGGNGDDYGNSLALDSSGRIVVTGYSQNARNNSDMVIWRYNTNGTLDTTFNGTGYVVHGSAAGADGYDWGTSVTLDTSGRILVAGGSHNPSSDYDLVIWRYNANGTLDTTFNGTGFVIHAGAAGGVNNYDQVSSITTDSSGRILVTGHSMNAVGPDWDMVIWRYNANGTLDTTFNGTGFVVHGAAAGGVNNHDYGASITTDAAGKIIVAGSSYNAASSLDMVIWRYNANGTPDITFNGTGYLVFNRATGGDYADSASSVTLDSSGRILVTGRTVNAASDNDMVILRLFDKSLINLPRTGQTKCYNAAGTELASCAGTGQDGDIQAGAAWPSPRFVASNENSNIIQDKLTGLEWAKDAGTPTVSGTPTCTGGTKTWTAALDYVACLNTNNYLGHSDWRLPNINELESLVNGEASNTATWLNEQGFSNLQSDFYWASSIGANSSTGSWVVDMSSGYVPILSNWDRNFNVLTLRNSQSLVSLIPKTGQTTQYYPGDDGLLQNGLAWPSPRFTDNGSTVTDGLTGLIWSKDANSPGPSGCNPATTKTWLAALDYVKCLNTNSHLGYNDWRLPNRKELFSLFDHSKYNPSISVGHPFTNVQAGNYWTSTTVAENTSNAWFAQMPYGDLVKSSNKSLSYYVWPVRGGTVNNTSYGLVAYYPFNGNANDESGNGNNGTVNGATLTTDRFGNANKAYNFNGSSNKINSTVDSKASVSQVTVSAWINSKGTGGYATPTIAGVFSSGSQNPYYALNLELYTSYPRRPQFYAATTSVVASVGTNTRVNDNNWHHVATVFDGSQVNVYLDGKLDNSQSFPYTLRSFTSAVLAIGYSEGNYDWWNGAIDEVRIYNRALSPAEIQTLYATYTLTATKTGTGTGTVTPNTGTINWSGNTGTASYASGTSITLTATADSGNVFTGWSGEGCTGIGTCTVTMDLARNVTANFAANNYGNGYWTAPGSMGTGRAYHTATLLENGKALIAGGWNGSTNLSSAVLYEPVTGIFTSTGNLNQAVNGHAATRLPDGRVLITGGHNGTASVATAELYNPATGTFTNTGAMNTARHYHMSTLLPNGKVLITGGGSSSSSAVTALELYDPSSGTFTVVGNFSSERQQNTATLLSNGKVLIAGGLGSSGVSTAEIFDPNTNTLTATGNMNNARYAHAAALLPNGKVLVAGGWNGANMGSAELYDPSSGTFSLTGSMSVGRNCLGDDAILLSSGKVFIGCNSSGNGWAELYDPTAGTFSATSNMNIARDMHTVTLLSNGKVLAAGGRTDVEVYHSSAELYTPIPMIQLPRTGQTKCYNAAGTELASCAGTGQDGDIQAGAAWPSPRFVVSGENSNIIQDKLTGLEWSKDGGTPTVAGTPTCTGGTKTWQSALDYVACLNTNNYLGHNDWRLPNINELRSMLTTDQVVQSTWLIGQGFANVQSLYWSSTTHISSILGTIRARHVDMSINQGGDGSDPKTSNFYAWPVRTSSNGSLLPKTGQTSCYDTGGLPISCANTGQDGEKQSGVAWPDTRFVVGTGAEAECITDKLTGLIWAKNGNLSGGKLWQGALDFVASINSGAGLCGYKDWRLPNRNELSSMFNSEQSDTSIWLNGQGFSTVQPYYWASSTYSNYKDYAWEVHMGYANAGANSKVGYNYNAWPVRGGTILNPLTLTDGLVAYYPFNGNANDASGYGNNGTVNGATLTTDRFGNSNKAYSFDGVNDYIRSNTTIAINTNQATYAAWVNFRSSVNDVKQILEFKLGAGVIFLETDNSTKIRFGMSDGITGSTLFSPEALPLNSWHYVSGTYDGSVQKLYIDGVKVAEASLSLNVLNSPINIGKDSEFDFQYIDGLIDDVRIYNRALSNAEIQSLYGELSQVRIAYVKNNDIWVTNETGASPQNLTNSAAIESNPSFSKDGSRIAFTSNSSGRNEIWTMPAVGGVPTQITNTTTNPANPADNARWSADGQWIYFNSATSGDGEVWKIKSDGTGAAQQLTNVAGYNTQTFAMSRGGMNMSYVRGTEGNDATNKLYVSNSDFTSPLEIQANYAPHSPVYSFDDTKILYSSSGGNIHIINNNGYNDQLVVTLGTGTANDWHPIGNKVLVSTGGNLYWINTDGTNQTLITQGDSGSVGLAWGNDTVAPTILSATSTTANGEYKAGSAINITLNFSEPVSSTGLTINLNSGTSITTGAFSLGSTWSGTYTVGAGQTSPDLTINSVTGTITDSAANSRTNPTIPAGQNIADAKAIVIDTTAPTAVSAGANQTRNAQFTQTATATDTNAMTYSWTKQAGPGTVTFGTATALSTTISASATGSYTIRFTATDIAGNSTYSDMTLTWDVTAPTAPSVTSTTALTNNQMPTWTWTPGGGGNGTYRYKLDSSDLTTGATETTALNYTPATNLTEGSHTLYVQERDDIGNWSASGTKTIAIDITGPLGGGGTGTFAATGSMTSPRQQHAAVLLPNGKVLIAGGDNSSMLSSAELYDPVASTFAATGSMNSARGYVPTATLLINGKVLIAGGRDAIGAVSSAELYDPSNGTFTLTGSMSNPRLYHSSILLPNGKVLIVGGRNGSTYYNSAELYDPSNGTFASTGSMNSARMLANLILLPNGKVLIAGGHNGSVVINSAELYDPTTGTFTLTGNMNSARYSSASTLLPNGKVLIAGGSNAGAALSSAELYNPETGTFSLTGSMTGARSDLTTTLLTNGKVLIAGAWLNNTFPAAADIYNPATGTFTATDSMVTGRQNPIAVRLPDGKVMVAGGYNGSALSSAELYTPAPEAITINSYAAATNTTSVTLTLSATDSNGVAKMMISNDPGFAGASEVSYAISSPWTLAPGPDGVRTVYVKFKDNANNWSSDYNDTIVLDTTGPTVTPSVASGTYSTTQTVTLTCNDGTGTGCGNIYYTTNGSEPTTSSAVYSAPLTISATTTLKFFAVDSLGNPGSVVTATFTIEGFTISGTSNLNTGLVAWYPFNGNANDESGNGNNGTVNGATLTTDRFGNSNKAYSFDGVNDYIGTSFGADFGINPFSISGWFKTNSTTNSYLSIIGNYPSYEPQNAFVVNLNHRWSDDSYQSGMLSFAIRDNRISGQHTAAEYSGNYNNDVWHHFVALRDSNDDMYLYVNGMMMSKTNASGRDVGSSPNSSFVAIGRWSTDANGAYFPGQIDDLRIYNRSLSASEIQALYGYAGTINAVQGDTRAANLNLASYGGYSQSADLTYAWVGTTPAGATVNITPSSITPTPLGATANVSFTAGAGTPIGTYTLRVTATSGTIIQTGDILVNVSAPLAISTTTLASGVKGQTYTPTVAATGGVGAYTFTVTSGTLPTGLTLNANGSFSGTLSARGTFTFTVQAADTDSHTATREYTVRIYDTAYRKLVLESTLWSIEQDAASGWIYAKVYDDYDALVIMASPTGIDITSTSGTGLFSADGASWSGIFSPDIATGASSKRFLYKDSTVNIFTITAAGVPGTSSEQWASGSHAITITTVQGSDTTPPSTAITGNPPLVTNSTSATFTFSANEPSTFECNLDSAGWVVCPSPQDYTGLSVAVHTFQVRAKDTAGNYDTTPASYSWTIDQTGPTGGGFGVIPKTGQTTSYGTRDDGALQEGLDYTSPIFTDNGSSVTDKVYGITWNKNAWSDVVSIPQGIAVPSPRFTDNNNGTVTDNLTGLLWLKNANCFGVQPWSAALSSANNLASGSCGLSDGSAAGDWRLPNILELASLPTNYISTPAAWLNGQGFSNVNAQANLYWSSSTYAYATNNARGFSMGNGNLGDGVKTAGSPSVWPVRGGFSNSAGTGITINYGAASTNSTAVTLSLSVTDANGVSTMMVSNDSNFTGASEVTYSTSIPWTLDPGPEGPYTVYAKFKDIAGNWSSVYSDTITLDLTVPTLAIGAPSATVTNNADVTYTITYSGADSISLAPGNITLNKTGTADGTVSVSGTGTTSRTVTITGIIGNGTLGISLAAGTGRDAAGNPTAAAGPSATFAVDNSAPTAPTVTSTPSLTSNNKPTWTWSPNGGGSGTFRYKLDSSNLTSGATETLIASYTPSSSLSDGSHTLYVQERDDTGNWSTSGSYAVTVDTTGPIGGVGQGTFTATGSMNSARVGAVAAQLSNGKVLITGGQNGNTIYSSAEIYDPLLGTFTPTGSMSNNRTAHTATVLSNGKVLITGGLSANNNNLSSAELYDPFTGTFTATGNMSGVRYQHRAVLLQNGKVLIAGGGNGSGSVTNTAELYDPSTGVFTPTGSMISARFAPAAATLLSGGKVLIAGGYNMTNGNLSSSELYDPSAETFSSTGSLNTARLSYTPAPLLPNGKVLVTGGGAYSGPVLYMLNVPELYDPNTGTFSSAGNMSIERIGHSATSLSSGKVLIAGGLSNNSNASVVLKSAELFDPVSGTFSIVAPMNTARNNPIAALLNNGSVLISGGNNAENTAIYSTAELYTPDAAISINSGDTSTNSTTVTLTLSAYDPSGVATMMISNDSSFTGSVEVPYSPTGPYTLAPGPWVLTPGPDGLRTVYVKFKDTLGNWSVVYSDDITLDTTGPVVTPSVAGGSYTSAQTVALSTEQGAIIYYTTNGDTPTTASTIYSASVPITISATTTLKFFAVDSMGNPGTFVTATYTIEGFSISANNIKVVQGNTQETALTLTSFGGFSQPVTLTYTWQGTAPINAGLSIAPVLITPTPAGIASVLSFTPGSTTIPGDYVIRITGSGGGVSVFKDITMTVVTPLGIITNSLGDGTGVKGTAFSSSVAITGGVGPFTYTKTGSWPAGLTLNNNGSITGTPTTRGTYTFTITVTDSEGNSASKQYSLRIYDPLYRQLVLESASWEQQKDYFGEQIIVYVVDDYGSATTVTQPTKITVTSSSTTGQFYNGMSVSPISLMTLIIDQDSAGIDFYYKDTRSGIFTITAVGKAGTYSAAWGSASHTVTVKAPILVDTNLTVTPTPNSSYGQGVSITGRLTTAATPSAPVYRAEICLSFTAPSTLPIAGPCISTDSNGEYAKFVDASMIDAAGNWSVTAKFSGDGTYNAKTASAGFAVAKVDTSIPSMTLDAASIAPTGSITATGTLRTLTTVPDGALLNLPITIEFKEPNGSKHDVSAVTDSFGRYNVPFNQFNNITGIWHATAKFAGNGNFNASVSDEIDFNVANSAGYAILLEGASGTTNRENYTYSLNDIRQKMLSRGFKDEQVTLGDNNIYYLSYESSLISSGIADAPTTKQNAEAAITTWAYDRIKAGGVAPLYLVMMDHGSYEGTTGEGRFLIDQIGAVPDDEKYITPADLDGWISSLETKIQNDTTIPGREQFKIIVINGSCYSGRFIAGLSKPDKKRVIITSSSEDEQSFQGPTVGSTTYGEYFVYYLFSNLVEGETLLDAFKEAATATRQLVSCHEDCPSQNGRDEDSEKGKGSRQNPLLDDNGDGVGSTMNVRGQEGGKDGLAAGISLGLGTSPALVRWQEIMPTTTVQLGSGATVYGLIDPAYVNDTWIEVKRPSFSISADPAGTGQILLRDLKHIPWTPGATGNRWNFVIPATGDTGLIESGMYTIYYYAKDMNNNVLPPVAGTLYVNTINNNAPGAFSLIGPENNSTVTSSLMGFTWTKSVDPDPTDIVTYTLKIYEDDAGGKGAEIKRYEQIMREWFTLNATEEKRADGTDLFTLNKYYHWEVEAIDNKGLSVLSTGANLGSSNRFQAAFTNGGAIVFGNVLDQLTRKPIPNTILTINNGAPLPVINGFYTSSTNGGSTYNINVSASGYISQSRSFVAVSQESRIENFDLIANYTPPPAPSVTLTSTAPNTTSVSPIPVTATFSENVTGFTPGDVTVGNGSISGFSGSGTTYTFNVTPASSGLVTVNIGAGVAVNAANIGNTAAAQLSRTYTPPLPPSVVITSSAPNITSVSPIPVTVTFSEIVTGFVPGDVTVSNGTISGFSGVGSTYTFNVTPVGSGLVTVNVAAGVAVNAANTPNTAAAQLSRTYSPPPSVTLTSPVPNITNVSPIPVTVTFSKIVTGFIAGDVAVGNGTISGFSGVGTTYTFNVTPVSNGLVTVNVAAGVAVDAANTGNTAAVQFSRTYDNVPPSVSITSTATNPTNISPIPVKVTFDEVVTGFIANDVSVGNGTISAFSGSGKIYTFNVTPTNMINGVAVVTVNVTAGAAVDAANNSNTAASQLSRIYDTNSGSFQLNAATFTVTEAGPTVEIIVSRTGGNSGAVSVSYTTSDGTAFAGSDFTTTSGTLSWASGDTSVRSIFIPILNDTNYEGDESFTITLHTPTGGAFLGAPSSAIIEIIDDEAPPIYISGSFGMRYVNSTQETRSEELLLQFKADNTLDYETLLASDNDLIVGTTSYSVAEDGQLSIEGDGETSHGIMSHDRQIIAYVDTTTGDSLNGLQIDFGIQQSLNMSNTALDGIYISGFLGKYGIGTGNDRSFTGRAEYAFDGAGAVTLSLVDSEGTTKNDTGTYAVATDGTFTITLNNGQLQHGIVKSDGQVFTVVETDLTDEQVYFGVGIRKSSGMTNDKLSGNYITVEKLFDFNGPTEGIWTAMAHFDSDGSGSMSSDGLYSSDGLPWTISSSYAVAADGTILTTGFSGIVSSDGSTFMLVKTDPNAGNVGEIELLLGVKTVNAPPVVSATTPTNDATPTWTWVSGGNGGNGTFRYRLDNPELSTGTTTTRQLTYTPGIALTSGNHTLYVQEMTAAGFWSPNGSKTILIDLTAPVTTTNAPAAWVNAGTVAVTLTATDDTDGTGVASTKYCSPLITCTPATVGNTATLNCANGSECSQTVRFFSTDIAGNIETTKSVLVQQDLKKPTDGTMTAAVGSGQIVLNWLAATDAGSGINRYKLVRATGLVPANCDGTALYEGALLTYTDLTVINGQTYGYRVCAIDAVENISSGAVATGIMPSITLTSPDGGESLTAGASYTIRWTYAGNPGTAVKLDLYKGGVFNKAIIASTTVGTAGGGSYLWTVPATQTLGSDYKVRVTSTTIATVNDESNATFTINPPTITLTSPDGGESLTAGASYTIRWTYAGNPGTAVKLDLYKGGVFNKAIIASTTVGTAGGGSYLWTVPATQTLGSDYKVRVTSTTIATVNDESNATFTINPPTITLTSPDGGESLTAGASYTIRWTYAGNPGTAVKLDLYKGGVFNKAIIASTTVGTAGGGSYLWTVPATQTLGSDYKVRVTSTTIATVNDESNATFTIR